MTHTITVDSRVRIPLTGLDRDIALRLRRCTTHVNPAFAKQRAMGRLYTKEPKEIVTWRVEGDALTLPSGAMGRMRAIFKEARIAISVIDARTEGAVFSQRKPLGYVGYTLRPYQIDMIEKAFKRERCVIRASTGSGKTTAAFALAAKIGLNCLVVLPNAKLLKQWLKRAKHDLGLDPHQVGIIRGAKRTLRPITLATQQTLWSREVDEELQEFFGCVIVDEGHHCFDGDAPILMKDGTVKKIRDVIVGDVVAVGGSVRSLFRRSYEGPLYRLNDRVLVTPEHPVATPDGWKPISSIDSRSHLYYDPLNEERMPGMQGECGTSARTSALGNPIDARVRDASCNHNPKDVTLPEALQDRLDARARQDRGRDRWDESHGARGGRRSEDVLPHVEGLARASLPSAVRLREGVANVHRLACDAALDVYNIETENSVYVAGGVLVHNCAANTFVKTLDKFPARYRIAFTADERRKDKKEFIVYDLIGDVACEVSREQCEAAGAIVDVEIRVVFTEHVNNGYRLDSDFNKLLDGMIVDDARNDLATKIALEEIRGGEQVILLTHRREHARDMDRIMLQHGVKSGCLLGAQEQGDEEEFDEMCVKLGDGTARAGVGTYQALGEGIDLPAVAVGIAMTPIATNEQMFNQVRGRLCRTNEATGKRCGILYVLYDARVFDERVLRNIVKWNRTVNIRVGNAWIPGKNFLKNKRPYR